MADLPTEEQLQVIQHPPGSHARVLAVAGSGKTTTMAQRVRFLVEYQGVNPQAIQVLMFNRLARNEFVERLSRIGLRPEQHPRVQTFHAFAYSHLSRLQKGGLLPRFTMIEGEEAINLVQRAIREVRREADPAGYDTMPSPEEALDAIGLWKGSLIEPKNAGYHGSPHMPAIYARFEQLRLRDQKLTYDDFVPDVVRMLSSDEETGARLRHPDFLIVDEYQDVNFGQQRLIEILAGERADIMVVGDDDRLSWLGPYAGQPGAVTTGTVARSWTSASRGASSGPRTHKVLALCATDAPGIAPDTTAPDTRITKGPAKKTFSRKAKFTFSSEPGATFTCALDKKAAKPCTSPRKVKNLHVGKHKMVVRATDAAGNVDPTPATYKWKVIKKPKPSCVRDCRAHSSN